MSYLFSFAVLLHTIPHQSPCCICTLKAREAPRIWKSTHLFPRRNKRPSGICSLLCFSLDMMGPPKKPNIIILSLYPRYPHVLLFPLLPCRVCFCTCLVLFYLVMLSFLLIVMGGGVLPEGVSQTHTISLFDRSF